MLTTKQALNLPSMMQFNLNNPLYLQNELNQLKQEMEANYGEIICMDPVFENTKDLHNRYIVMNRIGRGTFGDIWAVRDKTNLDQQYAIKMMRIESRDKNKNIIYEAKQLLKLNRILTKDIGKQFIIKCREILNIDFDPIIVMELCGCSLLQYMQRNENISFETMRFISAQLLSAMTFLHGVGAMVHADLKPANILIHYDDCVSLMPRIKLVDFGNALSLNKKVKLKSFDIQTLCYRAPEILCGNINEISCLMDIWSIGCILYELMNGKLLHYRSEDSLCAVQQIYSNLEAFPIYLYNEFKSMNYQNISNYIDMNTSITSYTRLKENRKQTLHKLLQCELCELGDAQSEFEFESFVDFISCLLDVNPLTRYNSEDALKHSFIIKDVALRNTLMKCTHPIIKCSNDDERQNRIEKQFEEYHQLLDNDSVVYVNLQKDDKQFVQFTIKQSTALYTVINN